MNAWEGVRAVLDALAAAGIPYMVTGGLVANAHGIAHSTNDADIVIQFSESEFAAFQRALPADVFVDPQISFETITGSQRQIVRVRGTEFVIELFFLGADPHHAERFARRIWQYLPDLERHAWIATAEDIRSSRRSDGIGTRTGMTPRAFSGCRATRSISPTSSAGVASTGRWSG